jgi:magnesium-protoporphyrin IX monomethyl ester (oxidative) cyclase
LINPPVTLASQDYYEGTVWSPPLGLAYLAGVLAEAGHDVRIIDCMGMCPLPADRLDDRVRVGMREEEILARTGEYSPDIIGVSCPYTANSQDSYRLAEMLKQEFWSGIPIIMGGAHASIAPEELFETGNVDYVALAEGEYILRDLCEALESGAPTTTIPGLLSLDSGGRVVGNRQRERIKDLDEVPMPRRDLLPMHSYIEHHLKRTERINYMRVPSTTMITSRGCPEKCVFCALRCTWGRAWVGHSPERVVDEIESLVSDYGIREIHFLDDSISANPKRLRRICELIIERGIDVKWQPASGIAIWTLDEELMTLMKKAGCYRLTVGIETGNPETLAFIGKRYTYEHALRVIKTANRLGMWTIGTIIVGFPYETREQMEDSIEFAISSGIDFAFFYCAAPFPGTDLYDICVKEGIEVPENTSVAFGVVNSLTMTAEEIEKVREEGTSRFVRSLSRRPWKLLSKIRNFEDLRYAMRVGIFELKLLGRNSENKSITAYLYGEQD